MLKQPARIVIALMLGVGLSAGQSIATGAIEGQIKDAGGAALPGVRVTIRDGERISSAITNAEGRFALGSLPPATYRVAAELAGFVTRTGTITLKPETPRAVIGWPLDLGCIVADIRVFRPARDSARTADAIAHIRIASGNEVLWSPRAECDPYPMVAYATEVLSAAGTRGNAADLPKTLEIFSAAREARLAPGLEYVVLLWREPRGSHFRVDDPAIFPILEGRVVSPPGGDLNGKTVAQVIDQLRRWSRLRPPVP
jgi:hypothetical protein